MYEGDPLAELKRIAAAVKDDCLLLKFAVHSMGGHVVMSQMDVAEMDRYVLRVEPTAEGIEARIEERSIDEGRSDDSG